MLMTDLLDKEDWARLEDEIHERFGLNARLYDAKGFSFTGRPENWCNRLCPAIRSSPNGTGAICSVANMAMASEAARTGATVVDLCDAGLIKICVPVIVDGTLVGVLGGCGRLPEGGEVESFLVSKATGLSEEEVERLAAEVPVMDEAAAQDAARFLEERLARILAEARV